MSESKTLCTEEEQTIVDMLVDRASYSQYNLVAVWRHACGKKNPKILELLIDSNRIPIYTPDACDTPFNRLNFSISQKLGPLTLALLRRGANVNDTGFAMGRRATTPVHIAVVHDSSVITTLANHGADLDKKDYRGRTPIQEAVYYQKIDPFISLIENGVDTDALGDDLWLSERFTQSTSEPAHKLVLLAFLSGVDLTRTRELTRAETHDFAGGYWRELRGLFRSPDGENLHEDCRVAVRRAARRFILEWPAYQICTGLQSLELPALVTLAILQARFFAWPNIPCGLLYNYALAVKHHNDPATHAIKKRRK